MLPTCRPGEEGTLRIAVSPAQNAPATTLVAAGTSAGSAWTWLSWQAGRHWEPYLSIAMTPFLTTTDDPRALQVARRTSDALMRSGRLRWVLEDFITVPRLRAEPPWVHVAEAGTLALWEGQRVRPAARATEARPSATHPRDCRTRRRHDGRYRQGEYGRRAPHRALGAEHQQRGG